MTRPYLRVLLLSVAALTGFKVWAQDRYQRSIYHEALLQAYGKDARTRCQKELAKAIPGVPVPAVGKDEVVIGNPITPVAIWDLDNPLWDVRYRHPHILITAETAARANQRPLRCAYDVTAGLASVSN